MPDPKTAKSRASRAKSPSAAKNSGAGLIPTDPLPPRRALLQIILLIGIPALLLLAARFVLNTFFPSLGY